MSENEITTMGVPEINVDPPVSGTDSGTEETTTTEETTETGGTSTDTGSETTETGGTESSGTESGSESNTEGGAEGGSGTTTNDNKKAINLPDLKYIKKYIDDRCADTDYVDQNFYKKTDVVDEATNASYAATAGLASMATNDANGQPILSTYLKKDEMAASAMKVYKTDFSADWEEARAYNTGIPNYYTDSNGNSAFRFEEGTTVPVWEVVPYEFATSPSYPIPENYEGKRTALGHGFVSCNGSLYSYADASGSATTMEENDIVVPLSTKIRVDSGRICVERIYATLKWVNWSESIDGAGTASTYNKAKRLFCCREKTTYSIDSDGSVSRYGDIVTTNLPFYYRRIK